MTIQLTSQHLGKSKAALQEALNRQPTNVEFHDPSIMNPRSFFGSSIRIGEKFACVLDHPKRQRFAQITRTESGFKVS